MALSKPFSIATEGPTVDGRKISREWLVQMAANYNQMVYTAVANLEHYLSSMPDSVFGAYGKVVSLSTRETEILGEKKLQLMAVVDASDELIALHSKGKKAFPSMEVMPEFAQKQMAYLTGIAFVDKPASLGTETMKFSMAGASVERFAFDNAIEIEFEAAPAPESAGATLFSKVKDLLGLGQKKTDDQFADASKAIEVIALSQKDLLENFASIEQQIADLGTGLKQTEQTIATQATDFAALKQQLGETDGDDKRRTPATGATGQVNTDC